MPLYEVTAATAHLQPEQRLADGRWVPISGVVAVDTDGGWVEVALPPDERTGRARSSRTIGSFRVVDVYSANVNPPLAALDPVVPAAAPATPAGLPGRVVAMVDGLTATSMRHEDGHWTASFRELDEVEGTGATEAEARAHARAQALDLGAMVAQLQSVPSLAPVPLSDSEVIALTEPAPEPNP